MVLAICWAFILGVIIGRGYEPIDLIDRARKKISLSNKKNKKPTQAPKDQVLKPTQLTFYKRVRQDSVEKFLDISNPQKRAQGSPKKIISDNKGTKYEYMIQVSSFSNKRDASALCKRLEKKQIPSMVKGVRINKKTWYRVYIIFAGTNNTLEQKMILLRKMGFKDFIVKAKKIN